MDISSAQKRCLEFRRRILDLSQNVSAMHIAPAFSCLEILDTIYFSLMKKNPHLSRVSSDNKVSLPLFKDTFILSKGHGCLAQYIILENLGILSKEDIETYCTPKGKLGGHPDYGVPGIEASTGSLGHGLSIALGMAYAEKFLGQDGTIYVVLGDGEMEEGSIWEAMMMAPNLKLSNLVAFMDLNDYQGLGKTSEIHPFFYPIVDKCKAFGWETYEVNGHSHEQISHAVENRSGKSPTMIICHTIKGKGVDFMIDNPIWHYRSPTSEEYKHAITNLTEVTS